MIDTDTSRIPCEACGAIDYSMLAEYQNPDPLARESVERKTKHQKRRGQNKIHATKPEHATKSEKAQKKQP